MEKFFRRLLSITNDDYFMDYISNRGFFSNYDSTSLYTILTLHIYTRYPTTHMCIF
jgi:hypothetical protein